MGLAKLVVVGGDLDDAEIELNPPTVFGRGRAVDVILTHPLVSRRHCQIQEESGQLIVKDLGSVNGTFVDGQQVSKAPLIDGGLLTVGTVTYRAVYHNAEIQASAMAKRSVESAHSGLANPFDRRESSSTGNSSSLPQVASISTK